MALSLDEESMINPYEKTFNMQDQLSNFVIEGYSLKKSMERLSDSAAQFSALLEQVKRERNRAWTSMVVATASGLMILALLAARL
jgi:meiotically up-regulated gene 157 (Mug157) protein